jgi:hypothetical protein
MVPGEGFEPPTFGLQNRCTAAVLTRPNELIHRGNSRLPIDGRACCYRIYYPNASFAPGKHHHSIPEGTVDPAGGISLRRRCYVAVNIGTPWSF